YRRTDEGRTKGRFGWQPSCSAARALTSGRPQPLTSRRRAMRLPKWLYLGILVLVTGIGCQRRPSRADEIKRGDDLFARKQFNPPPIAYPPPARAVPPDAQLFLKVVQTGLRAGPFDRPLDAALRAASLLPNDPDVQIRAARLMLPMRKYPDIVQRM